MDSPIKRTKEATSQSMIVYQSTQECYQVLLFIVSPFLEVCFCFMSPLEVSALKTMVLICANNDSEGLRLDKDNRVCNLLELCPSALSCGAVVLRREYPRLLQRWSQSRAGRVALFIDAEHMVQAYAYARTQIITSEFFPHSSSNRD
eukprot:6220667-Amphidinium_carterae.1